MKSPLPHLLARRDAFMAQSSSDVANRALLRCHGVICCNPPDVYLFALLAARRISVLVTDMEGKPTPGTGASDHSVSVRDCMLAVGLSESFSSLMSMSISGGGLLFMHINIHSKVCAVDIRDNVRSRGDVGLLPACGRIRGFVWVGPAYWLGSFRMFSTELKQDCLSNWRGSV